MSKLFETFKKVSLYEWKEKINQELKGADYNENLVSENEGITVQPIYTAESKIKRYSNIIPENWITFQYIESTNAKIANKKALQALNNDVGGLCFSNPNDLNSLLKNISVEHIKIKFINYKEDFLSEWNKYQEINNIKIDAILSNNSIDVKGKTAKEQIHFAISEGNKVDNLSYFNFKIGSDFFLEIAKIKAFRIAWKNITSNDPFIFCESSLAKVTNSLENLLF